MLHYFATSSAIMVIGALPTFVRHRSGCRFFCVAQKKWNYDGSAKSSVMTRPIPPDHSADSIFISSDCHERDRSSISYLSRQGIRRISGKAVTKGKKRRTDAFRDKVDAAKMTAVIE